jgi:hypothetical protein
VSVAIIPSRIVGGSSRIVTCHRTGFGEGDGAGEPASGDEREPVATGDGSSGGGLEQAVRQAATTIAAARIRTQLTS